jgi:uncharacterized membrane protein YbhN (UPF0104 family)
MTNAIWWQRTRAVLASKPFRVAVGCGLLLALVVKLGAGPFLQGLLSISLWSIVASLGLGAVATAAMAWRWRVIAVRFDVDLSWKSALALYYRSQFLNSILPGGVLGDVNRAIVHGRRNDRTAQTSRAVATERAAGQVVQLLLAVAILSVFGVEFERVLFPALGIGFGALLVAGITFCALSSRIRVFLRREFGKLCAGVGSLTTVVQVVLASTIAVTCHVALFAVAVTSLGVAVPPLRLAGIALVVLLAASIPLNIGGWGPREGAAAWAFALAGPGIATGVAVSTLFGVLTVVAVAPGALSHFTIERKHRDRQAVHHAEQRYVARRVS